MECHYSSVSGGWWWWTGLLREVIGSLKGIDILLRELEAVSVKSAPSVSPLP